MSQHVRPATRPSNRATIPTRLVPDNGTPAAPLPHSLEAERSVLGAIVLDNEAITPAKRIVVPGDFYLPQHGPIFNCMLHLAEKRSPIDLVTLKDELIRTCELSVAGGVGYVQGLADGLPRVTNVAYYARIVKEKSALRTLARSAEAIQGRALAGQSTAAEIVDSARVMFAGVPNTNVEDDLFDTWEEFKNAKPLRSLIEGVFQADVCNVFGGLSGDGKTLILTAITKSLLTRMPLFGYFKVLEEVPRVVYLIPECARAPFFHRAKLFGLEKYIEDGRLKVRTLSKGLRISLNDPRLLNAVKDAVVHVDTAVRFLTGEENDAGAVSSGLASDIFGLIAAGAIAVGAAHHSAKSFEKENRIALETVLRGSGDIGAFVGAGFGIRQIDEFQNIIHLEDIKPRDADPFPPFQIIGRPFINDEGDFRMHRKPNECGRLAEYIDVPGQNRGGGAPQIVQEARSANLALLRGFLEQNPGLTSRELSQRFAALRIKLGDSAIRKYRKELSL
jgi:hypothetical protein